VVPQPAMLHECAPTAAIATESDRVACVVCDALTPRTKCARHTVVAGSRFVEHLLQWCEWRLDEHPDLRACYDISAQLRVAGVAEDLWARAARCALSTHGVCVVDGAAAVTVCIPCEADVLRAPVAGRPPGRFAIVNGNAIGVAPMEIKRIFAKTATRQLVQRASMSFRTEVLRNKYDLGKRHRCCCCPTTHTQAKKLLTSYTRSRT